MALIILSLSSKAIAATVKNFSYISKWLRFNSETLLGSLPLRLELPLLEVWIRCACSEQCWEQQTFRNVSSYKLTLLKKNTCP